MKSEGQYQKAPTAVTFRNHLKHLLWTSLSFNVWYSHWTTNTQICFWIKETSQKKLRNKNTLARRASNTIQSYTLFKDFSKDTGH